MQRKTQELINFFKKGGGAIKFSAILKAGFHPDSLNTLERVGFRLEILVKQDLAIQEIIMYFMYFYSL